MHTIIKSNWKVGCLSQRSHLVGKCSNKCVPFSSSSHSVPKERKKKSHPSLDLMSVSVGPSVMSRMLPLCYLHIWKKGQKMHSCFPLWYTIKKGKDDVDIFQGQGESHTGWPSSAPFSKLNKMPSGDAFSVEQMFDVPVRGVHPRVRMWQFSLWSVHPVDRLGWFAL